MAGKNAELVIKCSIYRGLTGLGQLALLGQLE